MKRYYFTDEPIRIFGVPHFEEKRTLCRLPEELASLLSWSKVGMRTPGARMCFRTDSPILRVGVELATLHTDVGMSLYACQSAHILIGDRRTPHYLRPVYPKNYEEKCFEREQTKSPVMEDVTVFLPMAELIDTVWVEVADGARVEPPTPYRATAPIAFYGSSITEGAHASRPCNAYTAILSARLDTDYYNFGFSGNARGQLPIADYICTLDISALVIDYDHNAPDPEFLKNTHEPFFRRIRAHKPTLPILFTTRPNFEHTPDAAERRAIVRATYERAVAEGDKNVYFIDGQSFYGESERYLCTTDATHPNDIGHERMASVYEPILAAILENA
ncbi:MAG: hypothetical protein J6T24_05525 [Clostridia bacterium]|nr:hypothetical protein [Clostridia bacterium]